MLEALVDKDPVVLQTVGVGELDRLMHGDALSVRVAPEVSGGVHERAAALEVTVPLDDLLGGWWSEMASIDHGLEQV